MTLVRTRAFGLKRFAAAALGLLLVLPTSASAQSLPVPPPPLTIPGVTFTVNTSDDVDDGACTSAHCSFREAINAVNARANLLTFHVDAIVFNIPVQPRIDCLPLGSGCRTPAPSPIVTTGLPPLADWMNIDGTSQPGYNGTPLVEVRAATSSTVGLRLKTSAANTSIRGLSITGFGLTGIEDAADGSSITASFLGLEPSGAVRANGIGILVSGANTTIGGSTAASRNVISGNTGDGVEICACSFNHLDQGNGTGVRVLGNFIGTNPAGTAAAGNQIGVHLVANGFNTQYNICNPGGSSATIGAGNIISGNRSTGVVLDDCFEAATVTQNRIGTNAAGTAAVANSADGVKANNAPEASITRNIVSGNAHDGINITTNGRAANSVLGNLVGTDATGNVGIPNAGNGVTITGFPVNDGHNTIGGTAADANVIAFNVGAGVREPTSGATTIRFNSIHDNGGLGIDTDGAGVTANQTFDNGGLANVPELETAVVVSTGLRVTGHLRSAATRTFTLDFYSSPACDPSGSGEGRTYLGATTLTLDSDPSGTSEKNLDVTLPTTVALGNVVTATTTDRFSFTSEFSQCETVVAS